MNNFNLHTPTRILFGKGAIENLRDQIPADARVLTGADVFGNLQGFDMVVRTASLAPRKIVTDGKIWSATNEFFAKCPAPIIGVTGTKGKGTTASLISSILRASGKTVHLLGNIGTPALGELPKITSDHVVVFEMSSFQLWDLETSPHIAVVLMVEPDHMDIHQDMGDYVEAKKMIRRFQTANDVCVVHPNNKVSAEVAAAATQGRVIRFSVDEPGSVHEDGGNFVLDGAVVCAVNALQLPGPHNVENACAAMTAVFAFLGSTTGFEDGLRDFHGLPHRIEFVREVNGVTYINDSYSSAVGATKAALKSFSAPKILLVGGFDKGVEYDDLARVVATDATVKHIFVMGQTKDKIRDAFVAVHFDRYTICDDTTLKPIVLMAQHAAKEGDVVLLSPGCASFDMFKNFTDRGEQFRAIVQAS